MKLSKKRVLVGAFLGTLASVGVVFAADSIQRIDELQSKLQRTTAELQSVTGDTVNTLTITKGSEPATFDNPVTTYPDNPWEGFYTYYYSQPTPLNRALTMSDFNAITLGQPFDNINNWQGLGDLNWKVVEQLIPQQGGSNAQHLLIKAIGTSPDDFIQVWVDNSSNVVAVQRGLGVQ